ncbi:MAG: DUF5666 domain-containing protein [Solirubrobacterales bacterium]
MNRKRITSMLLAGAVAVLMLAVAAGTGSAKSGDGQHSFDGTVRSIAKDGSALTINSTSGSRIRFVVRNSTTFEHVRGLGGLSRGTQVEVHAFRSGDRWIATRIEANPGGRGGDDRGGSADDPPGDDHGSGGHGADDPPGDDHGSGGHGADD